MGRWKGIILAFIFVMVAALPAWAYPGKTGSSCTPCHTDGRSSVAKAQVNNVKSTAKSPTITAKNPKNTEKVSTITGLTRQEAARQLVIAAEKENFAKSLSKKEVDSILGKFTDNKSILTSRRIYVAQAVKNGLISGFKQVSSKGIITWKFNPKDKITTTESKVFLGYVNKVLQVATIDPTVTKLSFKPQPTKKTDHKFLATLYPMLGKTVAQTCEVCHPNSASEIAGSVHYTNMGQTSDAAMPSDEWAGMMSRF